MEPDDRREGHGYATELEVKHWLETGQFDSTEDLEVEEIVVGEPAVAATGAAPIRDADTALVDNLSIGTWLEFRLDRSDPLRARLAAVDAKTKVYIFTDRLGYIVAKRSRNGLAADFRRQSAVVCRPATRAGRAIANAVFDLKKICSFGVFAGVGAR